MTKEDIEALSHTIRINNKRQLGHVIDLMESGLSLRQISKVDKNYRENIGAAAKVGTVSPGEASN